MLGQFEYHKDGLINVFMAAIPTGNTILVSRDVLSYKLKLSKFRLDKWESKMMDLKATCFQI